MLIYTFANTENNGHLDEILNSYKDRPFHYITADYMCKLANNGHDQEDWLSFGSILKAWVGDEMNLSIGKADSDTIFIFSGADDEMMEDYGLKRRFQHIIQGSPEITSFEVVYRRNSTKDSLDETAKNPSNGALELVSFGSIDCGSVAK